MRTIIAVLAGMALWSSTGYAASQPVLMLTLEGNDCASCSVSVKRVLQSTRGVVRFVIDADQESLFITYDASSTNTRRIVSAVQEAGYSALLVADVPVVRLSPMPAQSCVAGGVRHRRDSRRGVIHGRMDPQDADCAGRHGWVGDPVR